MERNLEMAARQKQVAGCSSPLYQPKGIWAVGRGQKALGSPLPRGPEMMAFWFKFKEEFRIVEWIY